MVKKMGETKIIESLEQFQKIKMDSAETIENGLLVVDLYKISTEESGLKIFTIKTDKKELGYPMKRGDIISEKKYTFSSDLLEKLIKTDTTSGKLRLFFNDTKDMLNSDDTYREGLKENKLLVKILKDMLIDDEQIRKGDNLRTIYTVEKTAFGNHRIEKQKSYYINYMADVVPAEIYAKVDKNKQQRMSA